MIAALGLGKQFDGRWLFRNLSFEIKAGQSIALTGPSGSGKSVLLRILSGLLPPDEGSATIHSDNVSMLFQKNALFDSLTVLENLLFPLRERLGIEGSQADLQAMELLNKVGLGHALNLYPSEISGGMQKRLGIARALVICPEVLLYDEPTAGLDPITSKTIAELILSMRAQRGGTLFTVSTDIHRACQIGERVWLLANGQLRDAGASAQVWTNKDPEIRQFVHGLREGPLSPNLDEEPVT